MLWVIYYIIKKEFILDGVVDINVDKNRYSMSTVMSWYSVLSIRKLRCLCCDFLIAKNSICHNGKWSWAYNMAVCTVMFTTRMSVIFNSDVMKSSLYS